MTPGETAISRQPSAIASRPSVLRVRGSSPGSRTTARGAATGFTLIELLIVITIIGILITLAQPRYERAVTAAKEATLKEDLFIFRDVIDQYFADNGKYPPALNDLVEKRYIRRIPKDPITGSADTWTLVAFTDEQGQQNGVYDVKCGSEATALDGTRYSDW
jgi:general secretion pathway protein G